MDEQISKNTKILEQFETRTYRKRLKTELDQMYSKYDQIDLQVTEKGELRINVYKFEHDYKLQTYSFIITRDYPFRPPIILFQNRPYIEFLRSRYRSQTGPDIFNMVTKQNCFCCYSVNCIDNWGPNVTLERIIREVQSIKQKKRDIINKIIADKIKAKYLIDDIDLDQWLF